MACSTPTQVVDCSTLGSYLAVDRAGWPENIGSPVHGRFLSWDVGVNDFATEGTTVGVRYTQAEDADARSLPDLTTLGDVALIEAGGTVYEWYSTPSRLLVTSSNLDELQVLSSRQGTFESMGWTVGPGEATCSEPEDALSCDEFTCLPLSRRFARGDDAVELFPGQSAELGDQTVFYSSGSMELDNNEEDVSTTERFSINIVATSLLTE